MTYGIAVCVGLVITLLSAFIMKHGCSGPFEKRQLKEGTLAFCIVSLVPLINVGYAILGSALFITWIAIKILSVVINKIVGE